MAYGYSTDLSDYDIGERKGQKIPRGEMEGYLAQERGMADQIYGDLESGKLSVAQQQMQAGLAGTQRALATQAAAGGANPMAARGASYAGGMAGADVSRQTAALRAQEMQAARQMQMGALQRGTEGILQQQQMDLQAQQLEAQMLAEERLREEGSWGKTKDIVDMASFGFISDPRMKDVYASDPATKTISAYMPQGGGRYGAAMPMPVAPPPTMLVEVPNPAWYPGDVSAPEDIVVQSSRPAMPPTIMDYVNRGAYGPQAPVRQPGRAAGAGRAVAKKGEAPAKGAMFRGSAGEGGPSPEQIQDFREIYGETKNPHQTRVNKMEADEAARRIEFEAAREAKRIREGRLMSEEERLANELRYYAGQRGDVVEIPGADPGAYGPKALIESVGEYAPGDAAATTLESRGLGYRDMAEAIRKAQEDYMMRYPYGYYPESEGAPL